MQHGRRVRRIPDHHQIRVLGNQRRIEPEPVRLPQQHPPHRVPGILQRRLRLRELRMHHHRSPHPERPRQQDERLRRPGRQQHPLHRNPVPLRHRRPRGPPVRIRRETLQRPGDTVPQPRRRRPRTDIHREIRQLLTVVPHFGITVMPQIGPAPCGRRPGGIRPAPHLHPRMGSAPLLGLRPEPVRRQLLVRQDDHPPGPERRTPVKTRRHVRDRPRHESRLHPGEPAALPQQPCRRDEFGIDDGVRRTPPHEQDLHIGPVARETVGALFQGGEQSRGRDEHGTDSLQGTRRTGHRTQTEDGQNTD
ncbi:hypothetical protein GCM10010431_03300 [Streptomyces kunmingensis]